jgi:hypothetical protein
MVGLEFMLLLWFPSVLGECLANVGQMTGHILEARVGDVHRGANVTLAMMMQKRTIKSNSLSAISNSSLPLQSVVPASLLCSLRYGYEQRQ